MMKRVIFLGIVAGLLAACADTAPSTDAKEWQERTYHTGSNLPSKHSAKADGVTSVDKDTLDMIRQGSSGAPPTIPPSVGGSTSR